MAWTRSFARRTFKGSRPTGPRRHHQRHRQRRDRPVAASDPQSRAVRVIIFDACHSATMIRGNNAERMRNAPVEQLLPKDVIVAARKRARSVQAPDVAAARSPNLPRLVAFYACQTAESEPEGPYPDADATSEYHGLLTFALVRAEPAPRPDHLSRPGQGDPRPVCFHGPQLSHAAGGRPGPRSSRAGRILAGPPHTAATRPRSSRGAADQRRRGPRSDSRQCAGRVSPARRGRPGRIRGTS